MTIATQPDTKSCPDWCVGCTPADEGGYGHFSRNRLISLSMAPPEECLDGTTGSTTWRPGQLEVYLEQRHGAFLPTIRMGPLEGSEEETVKLGLSEVSDLIEALSEVREEALSVGQETP